MLGKDYNRIMAKYPRQVKAVETYIEELGKAEDAQESNIDKISGLTGTMLGEILHGGKIYGQKNSDILDSI